MDVLANKKRNIKCSNCGKKGHSHRKCEEPIISLGLAAVKRDPVDGKIKYLLIQRKNSIGFIEIVKGRTSGDPEIMDKLFRDLTYYERECLMTKNFSFLWKMACGYGHHLNRHNFEPAKAKFRNLYNSTLLQMHAEVPEFSEATEWSFPKGKRKKASESDLDTAKREFTEETNYEESDYVLLDDVEPVVEDMVGMDGRLYRYIYYMAIMRTKKLPYIDPKNPHQIGEIGNIGWFSFEEACEKVRMKHPRREETIAKIKEHIDNGELGKYLEIPIAQLNPFSILEELEDGGRCISSDESVQN